MAKILFLNVPAYGHVNQTLPVVTELVPRVHQVRYYNATTFEQVITGTAAAFRAYPNSITSEADFASRVNNLVNISVLMLAENIRLLPFLLEEIAAEKPALVIFDSIALWGMLAARLKKLASVASISTFVQDGVPAA